MAEVKNTERKRPIRVLVVDDSAIVRDLLSKKLSEYDDIEVVGAAPDAYVARQQIVRLNPEVLTLDIEMPRMDGLTFLKYLMKSYPLPTIVVSSLLDGQNELAMEAMNKGAVDLVPKPGGPFSVDDVVDLLSNKIRAAAKVDFSKLKKVSEHLEEEKKQAQHGPSVFSKYKVTKKVIAVGASTGGTVALEQLFTHFTPELPPVLTVIHMPQGFTKAFADRLNGILPCTVKEAEEGEKLQQGTIYIAPGNQHMEMKMRGTDMIIGLNMDEKVHNCRPSVDILFYSVAKAMGMNSCGIILTGMGRDGAKGLLEMRNNGAKTIAQDEETSIVFGMPKEAIDLGAVEKICSLYSIEETMRKIFVEEE